MLFRSRRFSSIVPSNSALSWNTNAICARRELRVTPAAPGIEARPKTKLSLGYFLSLVLFLCLILLLGFGIATALFTFVFLYGWVRTGWLYALIYTGSVVGVALLMSQLLALYWPQGILLG